MPIIPNPKPYDIERRFKHPNLTTIENKPDYEQMCIVREELFRNDIAIKSTFWGKKHSQLGPVQRPAFYHTEAGQAWTIPTSGGMYPTFSAEANDKEKKREVAEFINRKTHIKIAELVEELFKNQLLKAVREEYYKELRQGLLQYDGVSTSELLEHIFTKYARIEDALLIKNKREFEAPPDLSHPIEVCFRKQEECQRLAADGKIPISEAEMVLQVQTHLGATGLVNTKYLAWKKKAAAERKWAPVKKCFRAAISDVEELSKLTTGEAGLTENAAVANKSTKQQVHEEIAENWESHLTPWPWQPRQKTTP